VPWGYDNDSRKEAMLARTPKFIVLSAVIAAAVVGAAVGAGTYAVVGGSKTTTKVVARNAAPTSSTTSLTAQQQSELSVNQIYQQAGAGVVEITVTTQGSQQFPFGGGQSQTAQGSGFVYDKQGDIITDEHVVDGAQSVSVKFQNGATYKATVVGTDASTDLAVIKVNAPQSLLQPLTLADSSQVQVGDGVVAIGSPFGLENSVTTGIVSALHRDITAPNNFTITDTIQTDAAINHGNSGGVLLDLHGDVVGVTAQIDSESGGNDGVGFAIPSNTVKSIVGQLISSGSVEHAYLGVHIQTVPSSAASTLNEAAGVAVKDVVAGSPAAKAGLHGSTSTQVVNGQSYPTGGDVITKMNGKAVTSDEQLQNAVSSLKPGTKITLTVARGGSQRTIDVTLGRRPS
jgi:putative serine protease PepD